MNVSTARTLPNKLEEGQDERLSLGHSGTLNAYVASAFAERSSVGCQDFCEDTEIVVLLQSSSFFGRCVNVPAVSRPDWTVAAFIRCDTMQPRDCTRSRRCLKR
jgi:hypothetical protein